MSRKIVSLAALRAFLTLPVMNFNVSRVRLVVSFSAATFSYSSVRAEAEMAESGTWLELWWCQVSVENVNNKRRSRELRR